jgi:hypothetical protein
MDAREDQEEREGLAADQGARCVRDIARRSVSEESVCPDLLVEEIAGGRLPGCADTQALESEHEALRVHVDPEKVEPMHCETREARSPASVVV